MSFAILLNTFRGMATPADLDYLFGTMRSQLDSYTPTQQETHEFIGSFIQAIGNEMNKDANKRQERIQALGSIRVYNGAPGEVKFKGINPHVFAFQLALRVREPSLIDQDQVGLCGANSVLIFFAKHDPKGFAKYALDLMKSGKGSFKDLLVNPTWSVTGGNWNSKMAAADVVTMGSLGIYFIDKLLGEGAIPSTIVSWLTQAGFPKAADKSFDFPFGWRIEALEANLREAAQDAQAGKLVIIATNGKIVNAMAQTKALVSTGTPQDARKGGDYNRFMPISENDQWVRSTNHWTVVSKLEVEDKFVKVKLYSWKEVLSFSVAKDKFLSYYGGHVTSG